LREAIEIGRHLGLGRSTAVSMNNLGDGLGFFVGLREARAEWEEGIAFARSRGLTSAEMWQRGERLRALFHLGEWDELQREADEVVSWEQGHRGGQVEIIARIHRAAVLVHTGALSEAVANVQALLPRARESGDPQVLVPGLTIAALVAAAQGAEDAAIDYVGELERLTRSSFAWRGYGLLWPSRVAVAAGRPELARSFLDEAEESSAWDACTRLSGRALLTEARGALDDAAALYREAAERWDAYGSLVEKAYALLGLGRCGDAEATRDANAIFARLGARPVLARAA
jgi:tetratricopeptide (TPR) repeat protein